MKVLKGAEVSAKLKEYVSQKLSELDRVPNLAIVRIGEKPDDISYEKGALKKMSSFGLRAASHVFPDGISNEEFLKEFDAINRDPDIDGILLLRPLPKHIDEAAVEERIDPAKDLDGISPVNIAKVFAGREDGFAPCTAEAVVEVLDNNGVEVAGKRIAIIGRSMVVGRPAAMLLMKKNGTVTICHSRTKDMESICSQADILVVATGRAKMVGAEYVAKGAVVIDVGINVDENGKLCGDVDFDSAAEKASMITPVPGGVGTVTTAVLAKHLVLAAFTR